MTGLALVCDRPGSPPRGSFGARLGDDGLHLPEELGPLLARHGYASGEELVAAAHSFPGLLAVELGWTLDEVGHALAELVALLRGHVHPEILEPPEPPPRTYGARPPTGGRGGRDS